MFDVIGDVHGHVEPLVRLLERLDYRRTAGAWRHPERTAIFLGDWIDRGPHIRQTLEVVREMVDGGSARAVLGNHETNALAWATPRSPSAVPVHPQDWCRPRTDRNAAIHAATLQQMPGAEWAAWLDWFRGIPWWIDLGGLRCVHACWDDGAMGTLVRAFGPSWQASPDVVRAVHRRGSAEADAFEAILKGREVRLPAGVTLADPEGHARRVIRTRWFEPAEGRTYAALSLPRRAGVPEAPLPGAFVNSWRHYPEHAPPVVVGHYWLPPGADPAPLAPNVACVDYSVARGGRLTAYRWDGERVLRAERFVSVPASPDRLDPAMRSVDRMGA
ncbi:MAG: metallophosphoesterase, partial [Phycisphaerales bacterium]